MKKIVCLALILAIMASLVSCDLISSISGKSEGKNTLNGTKLKDYSIVYSDEDFGWILVLT